MYCREKYSRIYVRLPGSLYARVREINVMTVCKERTGWQVFNPPPNKPMRTPENGHLPLALRRDLK